MVTATQAGCALALLLLVPLGDRLERRRLMLLQLLGLVLALAAVSTARSAVLLLAGMLAVGLLGTAMTQGLIAYAASASQAHERGRVWAQPRAGFSSACFWRACLPVPWVTWLAGVASMPARPC